MNVAIRYFTKSKKGNTYKLATFIEKKINVKALDVSNNLEEKADILFLVNAMYAKNIDVNVKQFLKDNKDNLGVIYNVNSSASGASTLKYVKKEAEKYDIKVSDLEYHTVASWIFINKGRPNEEDFKKLDEFVDKVLKQ